APGGCQGSAVAVAHEELAAKFFLQRANARADRGLGHMQAIRRLEETSRVDDFKERACAVDIHDASCLLVQNYCTHSAFNSVCLLSLSRAAWMAGKRGSQKMPDQSEPAQYASPPCFMHE